VVTACPGCSVYQSESKEDNKGETDSMCGGR
jgi:hypothetical protein